MAFSSNLIRFSSCLTRAALALLLNFLQHVLIRDLPIAHPLPCGPDRLTARFPPPRFHYPEAAYESRKGEGGSIACGELILGMFTLRRTTATAELMAPNEITESKCRSRRTGEDLRLSAQPRPSR